MTTVDTTVPEQRTLKPEEQTQLVTASAKPTSMPSGEQGDDDQPSGILGMFTSFMRKTEKFGGGLMGFVIAILDMFTGGIISSLMGKGDDQQQETSATRPPASATSAAPEPVVTTETPAPARPTGPSLRVNMSPSASAAAVPPAAAEGAPAASARKNPATATTIREANIIAAVLNQASLINFDKPVPSTSIGVSDQKLVAQSMDIERNNISFYNDKTHRYESVANGSPEALQQAVANDRSKLVRVDYGVGVEHKYAYFKQAIQANREESPTGFTAAGWRQTDKDGTLIDQQGNALAAGGKSNVWLLFPGYTGDMTQLATGNTDHTPQSNAMESIANGRLNPQTAEAAQFTHDFINGVGREHIAAMFSGAHSMGVSNARAGEVTARLEGVPTRLLDVEPAGDTQEARKLQEALRDPGNPLYRQLQSMGMSQTQIASAASMDLAENTASIRVESGGRGTEVAGLVIGQGIMQGVLMHKFGGGNPEINNGTLGRKYVLDITAEQIPNASMAGHNLDVIINALKDSNVTMMDRGVGGSALSPQSLPVVASTRNEKSGPS